MNNIGNVLILGDSYSTFEGMIPEGQAIYYGKERHPDHKVSDFKDTWWGMVIAENGGTLVRNDSWSGTTICHTGYNASDCAHNSFAARFDKLAESGFFNENAIDTIFIFGGTNDSWAGSPIGEIMYEDFKKSDLYNVLPAFSYLLGRTKEVLKNTRVIVIINTELKAEIANGQKSICEHYGIEYVALENIEKLEGHPNFNGMKQIACQVTNKI